MVRFALGILIAAVVTLLFLPTPAYTQSVKADECLGCHEKQKGAMHGSVSCIDCHTGIAEVPHAEKLPRPACATCHEDVVRKYAGDAHAKRGLQCVRCHNAHNVAKEKTYCDSCHAGVIHKSMPARDKHLGSLSCLMCHGKVEESHIVANLIVQGSASPKAADIDRDKNRLLDDAEWHALEALLQKDYKGRFKLSIAYDGKADAHGVLGKAAICADCHEKRTRFGSATLRVKGRESIELKADPAIFIPEIPSIERYKETVHGKKGVACADCHRPGAKLGNDVCVNCHKGLYDVYSASVHAKKGAHNCTECHNPHRVKSYKELSAKERVAVCSRCHKDYIQKHGWLPNTALHFDYLECATCHSPQSEKSMVFYFAKKDGRTKKPLLFPELAAYYRSHGGISEVLQAETKGGSTSGLDIARAFLDVRRDQKDVVIDGSIIVTKVHHDYSVTRLREKECVTCHSQNASFYKSMFFVLPDEEGLRYVPVKGTLLSELPIGTFVDICVLGEEKVKLSDLTGLVRPAAARGTGQVAALGYKWIDVAGLGLLLVVILGVGLHIVLRLVFKR
jgi:predicted CXXCH cytochrome family protein